MDLFDLTGRCAFLTGGCGHLGQAFSRILAEAGATVFVGGRDPVKFKRVFGNDVARLSFLPIDIDDEGSLIDAYSEITNRGGGLDILVNNAVSTNAAHPETIAVSDFERGVDGTLNSVFRCIHHAVPLLRKSRCGRIINIASMYGVVSPDLSLYEGKEKYTNPPHYGAAKAAVIHLTKYYANFLAKDGICVNALSPGAFPSETVQKDREFIDRLVSKAPMGRIGRPEDLQGALLFLASDASAYLTGQNIVVDGGWTLR